MQALVFGADRRPQVSEVADPRPGSGDVVIKVEAAGICHTDHDILHGRYPAQLPRVPGHEFAGEIVTVGKDVTSLRVGERVAVDPLVSCAVCRNCLAGRRNLCETVQAYGADLDGGLAQFVAVHEQNAHPTGDLAAPLAALAEPLACATLGVRRANPTAGDRVLILGAGPIGLLLAVALRSRGITQISAADLLPDRLQHARQFGIARIYPAGPDLQDRLRASQDAAEGYDLVIDATGRPEVVQQGLELLAANGTLLIFGVSPPGSAVTIDPNQVHARQLTVLGSFSLSGTLPEAINTLRTTRLPMRALVSHHFPLADAVTAFEAVGTAGTLKIQVDLT